MSGLWSSDEIADATAGTASADFAVNGVAFDSREVGQDDLFIALKGETTDGHRFVDQAFAQGAAGAIVEQASAHPHVLVGDTTDALLRLGVVARRRTAAKIIGVTGSVGKTGTKEALTAALRRGTTAPVHCSVKSYNNHTGVPLSLARMPRDAAIGVFEMGMNHAGELAALTQMVRPHVALITWVAPAHIGYFNDEAEIARAKAEIFEGLVEGGTAIIPRDNVHFDLLRAEAEKYAAKIIGFGRHPEADVRALDEIGVAAGTQVLAQVGARELHFTLSQPGAHWVSNALAVLAAVDAVGGDLAAAGLALADMAGLAGRGERHRIRIEGGFITLIDESYNANPTSMAATLKMLGEEPARRKVAILGEMRELGAHSDALHAGLADHITGNGVERVLLVGDAMAPLASALEAKDIERQIQIAHVADAESALHLVRSMASPGSAVLVKGSNALGLSRLVSALKGSPS
ncbi:MAG: UDP-N-acetylmuramoyl-tripeptide--D-alanyl-D-alanine ligase [Alphaproteobacteria bacterium]|nr:UDP-N-acetylmuramoyl-tripeptide--D-alanyl-D-alanine ligase [Alphaproteobacteria bacterium]MDE2339581.1 UDP-N-acetylmuramoyl-tripeptide--D-alanyl-D-alanine ligase [Alphaproteobacteria bacterium]